MRHADTIERRIKNAIDAVDKLKLVQYSGTSNVVGYESETADTWDVDGTYSISAGELQFIFVFTADQQDAPLVSFHPNIKVNGNEYDGGILIIDTIEQFNIFGGFTSEIDFNKSVGFMVSVFKYDSASFDLKIKMRCLATDTGTITVDQI